MLSDCAATVAAVALLRQQFRSPSQSRLQQLEQAKALSKLEDETMAQYFQRARILRSDIIAAGGQWSKEAMRLPILTGLPSQYETTADIAGQMQDRSLFAL